MKSIKKILDILNFGGKKNFALILILIFFSALLDTLGVFSILPFIAVLSNPQLIETNIIINKFYLMLSNLGVGSQSEFLFILGLFFLFIIIISILFRIFNQYVQIRFALMREHIIGKILIEKYLHQPYAWFLNRNSADLSKNILSEVYHITFYTIVPLCNIISYGTLIFFLITLLFLVDLFTTLSVGFVLIISYLGIFYFTKKVISILGEKRLKSNQDRYHATLEAFGAFKEIKVTGLEKIFVDRFKKSSKAYAKSQSFAEIISVIPRNFIEGIAFGGVIIFILVLFAKGNSFENIIPIIALYTFAGYRLLPSMHNVLHSINQINFSSQALHSIHKDLMCLKLKSSTDNISKISFTKSISMNNIYFNYPNSNKSVLKNINLTIPAYNKVGIIGTSGSGKTTIIDIILGLLDPDKGTLSIDGNIINQDNKSSWQKNIGYVPQQIYLADASIAQNIAFGTEFHNINFGAIEEAAKVANLHEFIIKELPSRYNTIIGERGVRLSGGERQRLGIARALYHKPEVLILDEATSALDNITEEKIVESINYLRSKITIIIIAHRLSTIKNCDIIYLIDKGELKDQGTYEMLYKTNEMFKKMSKNIN
jgi:ABC-type multidrug transport system fused ATPase/permease subunit